MKLNVWVFLTEVRCKVFHRERLNLVTYLDQFLYEFNRQEAKEIENHRSDTKIFGLSQKNCTDIAFSV